ncbi:MAG TPA: mechanosensitive ion channel domain-containing protein, partial [Hyphomicrobiales bacterium]|nr:mechanosensitive ion channel domain-containing protein [Hyphomicrobiales bacterium]
METELSFIDLYLIPWTIKVLVALAIFLIGRWLSRRVSNLLVRIMRRSHLDVMLVNFLNSLFYTLMLVAVVLAAVGSVGVDVTSFLAIIGAASLAVGLALKDSLSNFAAGVMIIVFRPFQIGDAITAAGSSGTVDDIGMFCTLLRTADNQRVIIPNSAVINGTIINANALGTRRIDLLIGIGYDDNIGTAKKIIEGILKAEKRILPHPAYAVAVQDLAASSINLYVQ